MNNVNYEKFIRVCHEQLNHKKYFLQVGLKDWPIYFTKVRLKGTILEEHEGYATNKDMKGIFIDIFKMDNVSSNPIIARWQYFCGKLYLCYQLSQRTYHSASLKKKVMMMFAFPLKFKPLRNFIKYQVEKYNNKPSEFYGFFYGRTRYKSSIVKSSLFGTPKRVQFEDTQLPVPEHCHEYLSQVFGNYMELPPKEKRIGLHVLSVDFGSY